MWWTVQEIFDINLNRVTRRKVSQRGTKTGGFDPSLRKLSVKSSLAPEPILEDFWELSCHIKNFEIVSDLT